MYFNVIHMRSGKNLAFESDVPYSLDKIEPDGWNVITDKATGEVISVRGSEIAALSSVDVDKVAPDKKVDRRAKAAQAARRRGQGGSFKSSVTKS